MTPVLVKASTRQNMHRRKISVFQSMSFSTFSIGSILAP
jgi:hypothetical protein